MSDIHSALKPFAAAALTVGLLGGAQAAVVQLKVTVENLAPANSVSFAPLRVGFHNGAFDAFNIGQAATAPIISVAEGGSGSAWFPAFAAVDPTATLGTVVPNPAGPLLPGATGFAEFTIDTALNPFFTFASMVVPSNDFFIGNDLPTRFRLFDNTGNLMITSIVQRSRDIWDAGSEIFDPAAAAFVGNNDLRADQNSVVSFNFAELHAFNGLATAAGYVFDSQLTANAEVYRITFENVTAVPEPQAYALMLAGLGLVSFMALRRGTA